MPVGLRHDANAEALVFEQAADDGGAERRVVNVGAAEKRMTSACSQPRRSISLRVVGNQSESLCCSVELAKGEFVLWFGEGRSVGRWQLSCLVIHHYLFLRRVSFLCCVFRFRMRFTPLLVASHQVFESVGFHLVMVDDIDAEVEQVFAVV